MLDTTYERLLARKAVVVPPSGFEPGKLPAAMKPFQRDIATWACRRGRAAIFAGTGLGKTIMELAWGQQVVRKTKGQVLLFTPLAVAEQTVNEAAKFGIKGVAYAADHSAAKTAIVVTNYDRRDKFDISKFAGIILDESGIIKDQDSKTRRDLTEACRSTPYLLCGSATPAPNDWTELGQHAEFLGVMSAKEMLSMFFVHDGSVRADTNGEEWRLKGHAQEDFWRWVASWAVMIRHPRELGYEEPGYDLPPLNMHQVTVQVENTYSGGMLFPQEAQTLSERIRARKDTITDRVAAVYKLVMDDWACGSQNTLRHGEKDTRAIPPSESGESDKVGRQAKTKSTCVLTTKPTNTDGQSGPLSRGPNITRHDAKSTLQNRSCESAQENTIDSTSGAEGSGISALSVNSASPQRSMTGCSKSRVAAAQSARGDMLTADRADSISIIVTAPERFEGCSVAAATSASENSTMTPISSREQRSTYPVKERWLIWCNLNSEQDALEHAFGELCFSVYGSLSREEKVGRIQGWLAGERPVLLGKPSIFGRGLNLQCASRMAFCGLTDSFEQVFQAIRRCWRFGQTRPVDIYMVASEIEGAVVKNLQDKERKYDAMAEAMAAHMTDLCRVEVRGGRVATSTYEPKRSMELPVWLQ